MNFELVANKIEGNVVEAPQLDPVSIVSTFIPFNLLGDLAALFHSILNYLLEKFWLDVKNLNYL